jgi:hypothetical protein
MLACRRAAVVPIRAIALGAIICTSPAAAAAGQTQAPPVVSTTPVAAHTEAARLTAAPKLSDYLDGGSHPGHLVTGFKQRHPKDLAPATEDTEAYLAYDDAALYVGFVCHSSSPARIRARLSKREDIFSDDFVAVFLDTFRDKQRAYEFFTTPRGIQADGITAATTGDDYSWDAEWTSEAIVTPTGYVALIAIPFKVLRFPVRGDDVQHWGIALMRSIPSKDEDDFWPGISDTLSNFVGQFGMLDGLARVSPGRNVQVIPYATFTGARVLESVPPGYATSGAGRVGLDAKFVAHDALTFDLTLNPDFSQVETDDPQVTVNQRFEVFFPEKRPFFLENADVFNDSIQQLFFSRRLGDPQFGGRMTGKVGHWAIGAIVIDDRQPGETAATGTPGSGDRTGAAVVRARYDFDNESRVGLLGTARTFGPSSNVVGSVDTRIKLSPKWVFDGQVVVDSTTDLTGVHTVGLSSAFNLSRSGREFNYTFGYADASPSFHTDLGFIPRVNYRQAASFFALRWYPTTGPVLDYGPNSFVQLTTNWAGQLTDWVVRFPFQLDLRGRTGVFGRYALITETISGVRLNEHESVIQFNSDYVKSVGVFASYSHGTRPDYFPAAGLLPFLGTFTDVSAGLTLRPIAPLLVSETYLYSRLDARPDSPGTGTIFTNPIHRLRVNYQFSREWSLRAIVDYSEVAPNTALVALARTKHFDVDLLLTWLLHPGTALYLGYTDGYDNLRLDPLLGVEPTNNTLSSTGRQVFIKSSWLVRF